MAQLKSFCHYLKTKYSEAILQTFSEEFNRSGLLSRNTSYKIKPDVVLVLPNSTLKLAFTLLSFYIN